MFERAKEAAQRLIAKDVRPSDDVPSLLPQCLPDRFSFSQLREALASEDKPLLIQRLESLLILSTCLNQPSRISEEDNEKEHVVMIASWISKVVLPDGSFVVSDEMPEEDDTASREEALSFFRRIGSLGLQSLQALQTLSPALFSPIDDRYLLSLLVYSNALDPWTTPTALSISQSLISGVTDHLHRPGFITIFLLQELVRPLFSQSKPDTITSSGRKAMATSTPLKQYEMNLTRESKRWKYFAPYSITVLEWAISNASKEVITQSWHLITPPLLTLLDEMSTPYRLRGLQILNSFLPKVTSKLLLQTGLGEVFEDAVLPTVLFLPSITPLEESLLLLPAAYTALFTLAEVRYASPTNAALKPKEDAPSLTNARLSFYDRLLRKGIFPAYAHCSTQPEILQLLLAQLRTIVQRVGIQSVKSLKNILPILSAVLVDPFAMAKPELLLEGVQTLKEVLLNAWARIGEEGTRRQVIWMLVVGWKSIGEAKDEGNGLSDIEAVEKEMKLVGRVFVGAIGESVPIKEELMPLIDVDGSLQELFGLSGQ